MKEGGDRGIIEEFFEGIHGAAGGESLFFQEVHGRRSHKQSGDFAWR
jgi:hypothetical protein